MFIEQDSEDLEDTVLKHWKSMVEIIKEEVGGALKRRAGKEE